MDKNAKNAVAYFQHNPSGCSWYRIEHPMEALRKAGVTVHTIPIDQDIDESLIDSLMSFLIYGAVPFSMEPVLKYLKEKEIKIVYDMDDALDLVDGNNPFYFQVKKDVGSVQLALDYADEVTVATVELKKHVLTHYSYKGKVTVIPNCYDPLEWQFERPTRDGIRIGFAGSATHVPDLIEVIPAIKNLQSKYDIRFLIMGFGETTYEDWYKSYRYICQPEATKELRTLDELLKDINYEWIPFVHYTQYPQVLTNMALDIGICPLKSTPFNDCRSASKAMEYNLAGAHVLASHVIPYRSEGTSWLVDGNWEERLEDAITSKVSHIYKRQHMEWLKENRDINTKIDLLKSVYVLPKVI